MVATIVGACLMAIGAAVWLWSASRTFRANAGSRVPYFHQPPRQPDYRRTINALATGTYVPGLIIVGESGPHSERAARAVILGVIVLVVLPGAILAMTAAHNRRNCPTETDPAPRPSC